MAKSLLTQSREEAVAAGGAAANLGFNMQPQRQSNWCWAATSTSTSLYYNRRSRWTQCKVVNAELVKTTCCENGAGDCNVPWYLERALTRTGNLGLKTNGVLSFARLKAEIEGGRPVGVRIQWQAGGGHFVIIDGVETRGRTNYVSVRDPINGSSSYTYAAFSTRYQGTGSWTHTYTTQS